MEKAQRYGEVASACGGKDERKNVEISDVAFNTLNIECLETSGKNSQVHVSWGRIECMFPVNASFREQRMQMQSS